ncbi:MAG: hypothetical protein HQ581_24575 [Planctomycetes bacterium]|nr:hypothetical protein [Planctomycetota bacterium]
MLLADSGATTAFFLIVLLLTIGILLIRSHRYFGRRPTGRSPMVKVPRPERSRPERSRPHPAADVSPSRDRWEVEMHETARAMSAELDSKMGALGHLIREANQAAARVGEALEAFERAGRTGGADETRSVDPAIAMPEASFGDRQPPSQADALKLASPAGFPPRPATEPHESRPREHRYGEIYRMADSGHDTAEISRQLDTPAGEVELILGLRAGS